MIARLLALLAAAGTIALMRWLLRKRRFALDDRQQVAFMRATLASSSVSANQRVIVSLSTLPDRIANLRRTLECLLEQTRLPDEIVVALPSHSIRQQRPYVVPDFLAALPRVRVLHAQQDSGPATKFIPTIRDELRSNRPDTLIVVVDDDRIYPPDMIASYLHFGSQLPDAALCFRGAAMPETFDWHDAKMVHGNRVREPQRVAVITGCGSYAIRPRFFDESLWDYSNAPRAAFYMDDIWISGWLDRRNVAKYVVPSSRRLLSVKEQRRTMSLHDVPNGRQPNNNELIEFFRRDWNVFRSRDGVTTLREK